MAKKIVEEVIAGEGKNLQTEHNAWKRQPKIETILREYCVTNFTILMIINCVCGF
jgi:hypothetical protein